MEKLLNEYKQLKSKLVGELGCEETIGEVGWNDQIVEAMENLLKDVPDEIAKMIRLNHI
jgi:hypothetical protein